MLLGSNVFPKTTDPEERCAILAQKGYKAGYYPEFMYSSKQTEELIRVRKAFEKYNLVIAEVGAWHNNPTHPDPEIAQRSTESLIDWLAVAEEVGANCMVNIVGSAKEGIIAPENYSKDYYDYVVEKTRYIIDQVKPKIWTFLPSLSRCMAKPSRIAWQSSPWNALMVHRTAHQAI